MPCGEKTTFCRVVQGALDKVGEEMAELRHEISTGAGHAAVEGEIGDLLFSMVNICRYLQIDPEAALKRTNLKFERRFQYVERRLAERGKAPEQATLAEMDALWNEGKKGEG